MSDTRRKNIKAVAVGDGPQRREPLRHNYGARHIKGRVQVHLEGEGPARDESHAHVLPVLVGGILDDRPALQERLVFLLLRQYEPVARLPDGVLDHVADLHDV
jgi:hypothetical protein